MGYFEQFQEKQSGYIICTCFTKLPCSGLQYNTPDLCSWSKFDAE